MPKKNNGHIHQKPISEHITLTLSLDYKCEFLVFAVLGLRAARFLAHLTTA
jgi:hypothetical protein